MKSLTLALVLLASTSAFAQTGTAPAAPAAPANTMSAPADTTAAPATKKSKKHMHHTAKKKAAAM